MGRRVPWSLLVTVLALGLAGRSWALFPPGTYTYLEAPPDTVIAKRVTLAAGAFDTSRMVSAIPGAACADSSDTLGCGVHFSVYATGAVTCSVFTDGQSFPVAYEVGAGMTRTEAVRWVDSIITRAAETATVYLDIEGLKRWFEGGARY